MARRSISRSMTTKVRQPSTRSSTFKAALWVVLSCFCIAVMGSLAKELGKNLSSFQVAFFRAAFGLAIIMPMVLSNGPAIFRTNRPVLILGRGLAGAIGMIAGFYAVVHMPLADATAITFTAPLFITLLAGLVLGETVDHKLWLATIVGFLGVLMLIQPSTGTIEHAAVVALIGALAVAAVKLMLRPLAQTERVLTILLYTCIVMTVVTAVPAWLTWQTPTTFELVLLLAIGVLANLGQFCMIRGYRLREASRLAPLEYSRLLFAIMFGAYVFSEAPTNATLCGVALIVLGSLYVALSRQRTRRRSESIDDFRYMVAVANGRLH